MNMPQNNKEYNKLLNEIESNEAEISRLKKSRTTDADTDNKIASLEQANNALKQKAALLDNSNNTKDEKKKQEADAKKDADKEAAKEKEKNKDTKPETTPEPESKIILTNDVNQTFNNDPVTNFRLPQWGYEDFTNELDNFRKGVTSITGEPGWFYFKIFFHFDDCYGLLGTVLNNTDKNKNQNTAYNFLRKRSKAPWYKSLNIGARTVMLERFVKYLSFINSTTPWFFDKVSGLDKAILKPTGLTEEKTIEISCLEDAVDMRLTTLFHLYQYVCYDEIQQKEIVPENLRKFNMSIALYHVPIRLFHTNNVSKKGTDKAKFINDTPNDFANKMSYKLFTFRGCEFDLESIGSIIPGSVDNSKPFNLGKSTIKIKYDRCFTHLMNEWEQFMLGPEGIYYDPTQLKIGNSTDQVNRLNNIINSINDETTLKNSSTSPKIIASIVGENFVRYAAPDHKLGNIYNLNIAKLKAEDLYDRTSGIYLSNLFDYNPVLFRGLVIQKNVDPSKQVLLTGITQTKYGAFSIPLTWAKLGVGDHGYRRLPDMKDLNSILNRGHERHIYNKIWYYSSTLNRESGTEDFYSVYQLMEHGQWQLRNRWGTLYAYPDYRTSLRHIVDSYVYAWKNLKGWWKSMTGAAKQMLNPKSIFGI